MKKNIAVLTIALLFHSSLALAAPATYNTPEEASQALLEAAGSDNTAGLKKIFGSEFLSEISSGDKVADKMHVEQLAELLAQERQIVARGDGTKILEAG